MTDYIGTALLVTVILLVYIGHYVDWKCLVGKHKWLYAGKKSSMVFKKNSRGVSDGDRDLFKCSKCGAEK